MKKIVILLMSCLLIGRAYSQSPFKEKDHLDSLFNSGSMNQRNAVLFRSKWNAPDRHEFKFDNSLEELCIADNLYFSNLEKKVIFQKCLEWIAIKGGEIIHQNPESGKIIANGYTEISHYDAHESSFSGMKFSPVQASVNYTMILTVRDNKIIYIITNITYTYVSNVEGLPDVTLPVSSLYSVNSMTTGQGWIKAFTALNATVELFYYRLKESLNTYVSLSEK
jgi:hypothetical protein